jgi:predicted SnoaL-like aldol condensation-catalyzing enzyme
VGSPYRAAIDAHDPEALAAACAPDLVFHSPITSTIAFEGRDEMANLYRAVLEVYDEQHCVAEYESGDTLVVHLHARVGKQELDEVQILRLNGEGKVSEITMYVRPLPGLTALMAALAPKLAPSRWRAGLLAGMSRPLATATRLGDKTGARLVRPTRE